MKNIENLTTPTRERTSVPIQGIDVSTPDDLVKDGSCTELHNMRYDANAWRPVHPYTSKTMTANVGSQDFPKKGTIVYKHPSAGENRYVVLYSASQTSYSYYDYNAEDNTYALIAEFTSAQKISHFGNVLIFTEGVSTKYFLFEGTTYKEVSPNLPLPTKFSISESPKTKEELDVLVSLSEDYYLSNINIVPSGTEIKFDEDALDSIQKAFNYVENQGKDIKLSFSIPIYDVADQSLPSIYNGDEIWGNICFLVTYRMADGSTISISPLYLSTRTEKYAMSKIYKGNDIISNGSVRPKKEKVWIRSDAITLTKDLKYTDLPIFPVIYRGLELQIGIPKDVVSENSIVDSVAIYASRVHNPFDANYLRDMPAQKEADFLNIYNSDDIFNSPLYLLEEYSKSEIRAFATGNNDDYLIDLYVKRSMLDSAITNEVYIPSITMPLSGTTSYDYNNRLHIGDTSIDYINSSNISPKTFFDWGGSGEVFRNRKLGLSVESEGLITHLLPDSYSVTGAMRPGVTNVISYPDTSVKAFLNHIKNQNVASYPCKQAYNNGISYYVAKPTNEYHYPPLGVLDDNGTMGISATQQTIIRQPNRLQVSETNNCFSLPYNLSYRIGSENNRIIAMQSAAIKIGDEQVGALPLYVFTEEGIYALRAGESTLYSAINPINYDRIINPSTLAINGAVAYITEKGVHILTGEGSKVISTPIHKANGLPDLDFLKGCVFLHPKQFNEILLYNSSMSKAYVYNLDEGYWSTRELNGEKINTDEVIQLNRKSGANIIYDLNDENENTALTAAITTRPIKLGNVEFKRLETIIPRMTTGAEEIAAELTLSVDNTELRKTDLVLRTESVNPFIWRRVPFSAKYFVFSAIFEKEEGETTYDLSFTHIDFEWYRRFSRRMR